MCRSNTNALRSVKQIAEQFKGLPHNVKRFSIIDALEKVGNQLDFSKNHITYLKLMLSYTRENDWHNNDSLPMVWLSVTEIANKLNLSRQQVTVPKKLLLSLELYTLLITVTSDGSVSAKEKAQSNSLAALAYDLSLHCG